MKKPTDIRVPMKVTKMNPLRVKDNNYTAKKSFQAIPGLTKRIADKTLDELEKEGVFIFPELIEDSEDLSGEQVILQSHKDCYRTGNVMGFLGYGEERLVIESRFSEGEEDYFFRYLMERVMNFPNLADLESDVSSDTRLYSLLLYLFPKYLAAALRKGPYKSYIQKEYNDGNVRGKIDIPRHIRKNVPFVGKIAYNQREYSYDNYLMQLIRHTIEFIKIKPYGYKLLAKVKEEVKLVNEATRSYKLGDRRKVLEDNKKNTVRHAFYHEYRALQRLCILILQDEKINIGHGNKRIYGILFDGAWLWEEYVNSLVGDIFEHPMNKAHKGAQWLFAGNEGCIYPDFIGKDKDKRIIADAKYKPADNIGHKDNKDYFQVLAYMLRFDAKTAFYFYPEVNPNANQTLWLNSGTTYDNDVRPRKDICLIKRGITIPSDVTSYEEFKKEISESEREFINQIRNTPCGK